MSKLPPVYITVYMPIAGWKAMKLVLDEEYGFHEPWETDCVAFRTVDEAIEAGKRWAKIEDIPFIYDKKGDEEPAPDKSVTEQLLEIIPDAQIVNL